MIRYVSVSEIQSFLNDRWRWYAAWVLNRVPRKWSEALELGTAVHDIFEMHFGMGPTQGLTIEAAFDKVHAALGVGVTDPDEAYVTAKAKKALLSYRPQIVGFRDRFMVEETLEVERPFELDLFTEGVVLAPGTVEGQVPYIEPATRWALRGRPDRVVRIRGSVYHMQHKTAAIGKDLGMYASLISRSMHEGCYGAYLDKEYPALNRGGTILNVIRKAVAGPRHPLEGLSYQTIIAIPPEYRKRAMQKAVAVAKEMAVAEAVARSEGHDALIDNTYHDDGYFHNSLDGYFDVLRGKASLLDDSLFMPREETY